MAYFLPITIPQESVAETLTGFPVFIDLSTLPAGFWSGLAYADGRDIRVTDTEDADLPFDLVLCDSVNQIGALFVKLTLTTADDTVVRIHFGDSENDFVAVDADNGRNAVWSAYHRVLFFSPQDSIRTGGGLFQDHCGSGETITWAGTLGYLEPVLLNATELGVHQGVAFDGTYYYLIGTNLIKKYDTSFNLITSNTDPCGDIGNGVDHIGDGVVVDGILYVPTETYSSCASFSNQRIAKFNASDLSFISSTSISAQGHEAASICYIPEDEELIVATYCDYKLYRYAISDLSYQGMITLSSSTQLDIQGITYFNGHFYANRCDEATGVSRTTRYLKDGTVTDPVCPAPNYGAVGQVWQGIDHTDTELIALYSTGADAGKLYRLIPVDMVGGTGLYAPGWSLNSKGYMNIPVSRYTVWTIGCSVKMRENTQNSAIWGYAVIGSDNTKTTNCLPNRESTNQMGLWNTTDSWLFGATVPDTTQRRLHAQQNGTTNRKFFTNGTVVTDTGCSAFPPSGGASYCLNMAASLNDGTDYLMGRMAFIYLINALLSQNWIDAEVTNINTPTSFYEVGSVVEVVTGVGAAIQSPAVATADGYAQVSGSGGVTAVLAVVTGLAAHGVSGAGVIVQAPSVVEASGQFGETVTGTGEAIQSCGVVAAAGAHGVSGTGQAIAIPATVSALGGLGVSGQGEAVSAQSQVAGVGAHGVSGQGAVIESPASVAADGYVAPSGIGQVVGVSGTIAGEAYFGFIVLAIAHIVQPASRMFARGTFRDPLRSQAKRYFESLPVSDLRERAVNWIEEEITKAA